MFEIDSAMLTALVAGRGSFLSQMDAESFGCLGGRWNHYLRNLGVTANSLIQVRNCSLNTCCAKLMLTVLWGKTSGDQ
jgi:hypothetical protein